MLPATGLARYMAGRFSSDLFTVPFVINGATLAEGVLVVDGSIPYYGVGPIREPVTFRIQRGVVRSVNA